MNCDTGVDMSYGKLKCASTMNLPGMSPFKIHDYPCHTCMDVNGKRANDKSVSGRDTCDVQFDLFDMSKCESIGGHRYCTVIVMRQSRFVFIFLHKTKDEIQSVWTKYINTLGDTNWKQYDAMDPGNTSVKNFDHGCSIHMEFQCHSAVLTGSTRMGCQKRLLTY